MGENNDFCVGSDGSFYITDGCFALGGGRNN
jgi:hypothetical protein